MRYAVPRLPWRGLAGAVGVAEDGGTAAVVDPREGEGEAARVIDPKDARRAAAYRERVDGGAMRRGPCVFHVGGIDGSASCFFGCPEWCAVVLGM